MTTTFKTISSAAEFKEIINKTKDIPVLVMFGAPWCGPCKTMKPILEQVATQKEMVLAYVDAEECPELAQEQGIRGFPTTLVFENGSEKLRASGLLPKLKIVSLLA